MLSLGLLPALRKRGHEIAVVTGHGGLDLPDESSCEGIPVHRFPFWAALAARDMTRLVEVRQRVAELKCAFAPDLVHLNTVGPSVFFHAQTAFAHRAPVLAAVHALPSPVAGADTLVGRTLRAADWVACVSAALLAEARRLVPEITPRSSVIYNGLPMPALAPCPPPVEAPRLLCAGRLVADKGFDLALAAFGSLVGRFPTARLVIAGDGPARPQLERQATELGLTRRVEFVGWVSPHEIPALMSTATLFVIPSRWDEPFGMVAVEAALMARPVVATRVGGLPEVVRDGETGVLVEREDSAALAEAIARLLEDPSTAARLGEAARRRACDLFGLSRCVDAYDALYRTLVNGGTNADASESAAAQSR